jgi:hypothetical protein
VIPLDIAGYLTGSHTPTVRFELWTTEGLADSDFGRFIETASIESDATRWPRHSLRATVADIDAATAAGLNPGDARLRVFCGVATPDRGVIEGQTAEVWVQEVTATRGASASATLTAASLEARISGAGLASDLQPLPGETVAALITRLAADALGWTPTVAVSAGDSTPVPADLGISGDPWAAIEDAARAASLAVSIDRFGRLCLDVPPALSGTAAAEIRAGEGGTLIESRSRGSRAGGANAARIVYRSTDPGVPDVVGVARQTTGPVRWDGPLGRLTYTDTRDGPVTQAEADTAARAALTARLGLVRETGLTAVPDPRLEPGDTIEVGFANGVRERHLLTAVARDLAPLGPMELRTRGDFLADAP